MINYISDMSRCIWQRAKKTHAAVVQGSPYFVLFKGQLVSKCPYERSVSSKIPTKIFLEFCLEIFCSFLGFLGFLGT